MVAVSENTGSAPLIGSEVIRDRASDESEVQCQIRRKLRPVRGEPDAR